MAQWKDECYYPATVVSLASHSIDVRFTDESVMSVQRENLMKCSLIPVGYTVLARNSKSGWYELAVIQSYYTDGHSQEQGYTVMFTGQTTHDRYSLIILLLHYMNSLMIVELCCLYFKIVV